MTIAEWRGVIGQEIILRREYSAITPSLYLPVQFKVARASRSCNFHKCYLIDVLFLSLTKIRCDSKSFLLKFMNKLKLSTIPSKKLHFETEVVSIKKIGLAKSNCFEVPDM